MDLKEWIERLDWETNINGGLWITDKDCKELSDLLKLSTQKIKKAD